MEVKILLVDYSSKEYQKSLDLRLKVLRIPLGMVSFTELELDLDKDSMHIVALSGEDVVGTLILTRKDLHTMKMRQVCVDQDHQSQSIGKKLVLFAEELAHKLGAKGIELHARASVASWYQKLGFSITSEEFTEIGLPHFRMFKVLRLN